MSRTLAGAAIAGAAAVALGQLASPFHVATHEFTQFFSLIAFFAVVVGSWRSALRREPHRVSGRLPLALGTVAAAGAGAMLAHAAFNELVHGCRPQGAVAFFWITWAPLGAFAAVLGTVLGERRWSGGRVAATLALLVVACAIHDVMQVLGGVRIFDPLLGEPNALDQRASMEISALQLFQRAWLVGLASALWALHRSMERSSERDSRRWSTFVVFLFVGVTIAGGSHFGVGWGTDRLRTRLDQTRVTPHFELLYAAGGPAEAHIEAIARECEWQWHLLSRDWGPEAAPVEVRVFDDEQAMREATSRADAHALPGRINAEWRWVFSDTLPHELVHVLQLEGSWWRPSRWLRRGFIEGSAEAWAGELVAVPEAHRLQAAALAAGQLPPIAQVMSVLGFWTLNESAAYDAAGSFVGWLVAERGVERFRALDRRFDFEQAYGESLAELEASWRLFLSRIEYDPEVAELARLRFDPELAPAYVESTCPKLGPREVPLEQRAQRSYAWGDWTGALALYRALLEQQPSPHWAARVASCFERLGAPEQALPVLDHALSGASEAEADALLTRRIVSLMMLRDWEELERAIEERDRRAEGTSPERRAVADCLRDPDVREDVARALDPRNASLSIDLLDDLAARYPDRRCLLHLAEARRPHRWLARLDAATREHAKEQLPRLALDPAACVLTDHFSAIADVALRDGELELAETLSAEVVRSCSDPLARHRAERRLERIAWERNDPLGLASTSP